MKGGNVLEGYAGMDQVIKKDCRANGEVILEVRQLLQPHFWEMPSPWIQIESFSPRTTDNCCERKNHAQ